jgi:2-keto-myo-inositol isomerase
MITRKSLALNRIAAPGLTLERFFALAKSLEIEQVELRNDLPGGSVTDELPASEVAQLSARAGVKVCTINALQKFNLEAARAEVERELQVLAETAMQLGCGGVVLCPNNDVGDRRTSEQMYRETVAALCAWKPTFERTGMLGLVEPLGFPESSLRSGLLALRAIEEAGGACYRIVHDTFHHALGPNPADLVQTPAYVERVGLVHISGVESGIPKEQYRDAHRILVGPRDRLDSRGQVRSLMSSGYTGQVSFEPFAAEVQRLAPEPLRQALEDSLRFLLAA